MDSNIALALMAKARRAFEHEGVFLSFPVAPVQFSKDDLAQINSATTGAGLARAADFSRLVNAIPEGVVWMPGSDRPLWSTHRRVLKGPETVLAQGSLSPGQEEALRIAAEVLSGDKFAAYSQYRAGWDALKNRYQLAKADADLSTDAALKSKWRDQTEPDLRPSVQVLECSWATLGFRDGGGNALRHGQTGCRFRSGNSFAVRKAPGTGPVAGGDCSGSCFDNAGDLHRCFHHNQFYPAKAGQGYSGGSRHAQHSCHGGRGDDGRLCRSGSKGTPFGNGKALV